MCRDKSYNLIRQKNPLLAVFRRSDNPWYSLENGRKLCGHKDKRHYETCIKNGQQISEILWVSMNPLWNWAQVGNMMRKRPLNVWCIDESFVCPCIVVNKLTFMINWRIFMLKDVKFYNIDFQLVFLSYQVTWSIKVTYCHLFFSFNVKLIIF